MNRATAKEMKVRHYGVNSGCEYYKVNETHNVLYTGHKDHPLVCIDCRSNECDHTEAVKDHLQEKGIAA
jgi:hypothetical protein